MKTVGQYKDIIQHVGKWLHLFFTSTDYDALITDSQCLPLSISPGAEPLVRRKIRGFSNVVKNRLLQSLFSSSLEIEKANLVTYLMSIRPVNPRVLNKFYALSNHGLQTTASNWLVTRIMELSCTTDLTYALCNELWGHHLEDITMPAQQEQISLHPYEDISDHCLRHTILIDIEDTLTNLHPPPKAYTLVPKHGCE